MDKIDLKADCEAKLSIRQIAKMRTTSYTNVRYWLKVHGLRTMISISRPDGPHKRLCKCGEDDPQKFYGKKGHICARCQNEYNIRKGRDMRQKCLDYLGAYCRQCGFDKHPSALEFHHIDPSEKDAGYGHYRYWTWERAKKEMDKCTVLCSNCHRAHHAGELILVDAA